MSALPPKATSNAHNGMSALSSKANIRGDDRESEPSCAVRAIRERSLQIISYLSDARISTRLVLLTAGCTRDADGTNYFVTSFDRHAATNCNHIRDLLQIGTLRLI